MKYECTLRRRPVDATPNSGSVAGHPINGIHQDQKAVQASLELNKIDSFCEYDVPRFQELLATAFAKTDELTRVIHYLDQDPANKDMEYRRRWTRQEEDSRWRAVRTCRAAQIHDELLMQTVAAEDAWLAAINTPTEPETMRAARDAWNFLERARYELGLDKLGPPFFLGPVPPDSTGVLARMGIVDGRSQVLRRAPDDTNINLQNQMEDRQMPLSSGEGNVTESTESLTVNDDNCGHAANNEDGKNDERTIRSREALAAILCGLDIFDAFYNSNTDFNNESDIAFKMSWALEKGGDFISSVAPDELADAKQYAASMEIDDVLDEDVYANHSFEFLTILLESAAEKVVEVAPSTAQLIRSVAETEESILLEPGERGFPSLSKAAVDALELAKYEIDQLLNPRNK